MKRFCLFAITIVMAACLFVGAIGCAESAEGAVELGGFQVDDYTWEELQAIDVVAHERISQYQ